MIVVDSSVWINQLRGVETRGVRALESLSNPLQIIVGDLVLLEVLQGARSDAQAANIEQRLRRFSIEPMLDSNLVAVAAANYRALRRVGLTIRTSIDMIIATFCIQHEHVLLQDDRDFLPMAKHLGLKLA